MIFVVHQHHPHSSRMRSSHPVTRLFPSSILSRLDTADNSYNRHISIKKAPNLIYRVILIKFTFHDTPQLSVTYYNYFLLFLQSHIFKKVTAFQPSPCKYAILFDSILFFQFLYLIMRYTCIIC